jgi:hypothetical protein
MKTKEKNITLKSFLLPVVAIVLIISFPWYAKKVRFRNSTVVPGADGTVKVKKDKNQNYLIKVKVSDLAEAEKVQASKTTYVVWMETDEGNVENLGQLKSSTNKFSKGQSASLETVSAYKPVKIFITTEKGENTQHPGSQIVLTTENFKIK